MRTRYVLSRKRDWHQHNELRLIWGIFKACSSTIEMSPRDSEGGPQKHACDDNEDGPAPPTKLWRASPVRVEGDGVVGRRGGGI